MPVAPSIANIWAKGGPRPPLRPPFEPLDTMPFLARGSARREVRCRAHDHPAWLPFPCTYCAARMYDELYAESGHDGGDPAKPPGPPVTIGGDPQTPAHRSQMGETPQTHGPPVSQEGDVEAPDTAGKYGRRRSHRNVLAEIAALQAAGR